MAVLRLGLISHHPRVCASISSVPQATVYDPISRRLDDCSRARLYRTDKVCGTPSVLVSSVHRGILTRCVGCVPLLWDHPVRRYIEWLAEVARLQSLLFRVICPLAPRKESYDTSAEISGQLPLDRPSDQLSPRTPPAIVYPDRSRGVDLDLRANASFTCSSNFPRQHSVSARAARRPFLFAFYPPTRLHPPSRRFHLRLEP
jgi:hypothetical protein